MDDEMLHWASWTFEMLGDWRRDRSPIAAMLNEGVNVLYAEGGSYDVTVAEFLESVLNGLDGCPNPFVEPVVKHAYRIAAYAVGKGDAWADEEYTKVFAGQEHWTDLLRRLRENG